MNEVLAERKLPGSQTVQIVRGDLTAETAQAIVNAANAQLLHGGGVAGAIARGGGPTIQEESTAWVRKHGPVLHENPAWTSGGGLAAKYVIHAVGPIWGEGDEDKKLSVAVHGALRVADELKVRSVSLPAISTGIYGFPKERAANIILSSVAAYFARGRSTIETVRIVLLDDQTVEAFMQAWDRGA